MASAAAAASRRARGRRGGRGQVAVEAVEVAELLAARCNEIETCELELEFVICDSIRELCKLHQMGP